MLMTSSIASYEIVNIIIMLKLQNNEIGLLVNHHVGLRLHKAEERNNRSLDSVLSVCFLCLSVYASLTGHSFWHMTLIFGI